MFFVSCNRYHGKSIYRIGCSAAAGHYSSLTAPNLQPTANQERHDQCGNQQHSRELLMMGIVIPETCWAYKKYNKIISGIYLVFYSSVIRKMHGPVNIRSVLWISWYSMRTDGENRHDKDNSRVYFPNALPPIIPFFRLEQYAVSINCFEHGT